MNMIIRDGTGAGYSARVFSDNHLAVDAIQSTLERSINETTGRVWTIPFETIDPTGADDYFIYIKNNGSTFITVTDFRIFSTVSGIVQVRNVSGTAVGGTDITPVGRNLGLDLVPTDTILQSGVDITGLTNEGIIFFIPLDTADKGEHLRTSAGILISPGKSIALIWDTSTGILSGTISMHERDSLNA